ncbi:hypothetical protein ACFO0N_08925 [Halobium salinum]|uniref:Uncharacterized protein n=1 Tax=Halobium salinum TaxID=1364940 RepID=A0ABD5PBL3_9EURY|nr:hypothetical protein [Halobium salinum]
MLGYVGTAGVVLGTAGVGAVMFSGTGVAIDADSLRADAVTLTSNNGEVERLTLRPDLVFSWDGLDATPETMSFSVDVRLAGTGEAFTSLTTEETSVGADGLAGEERYRFSRAYDLVGSGPLDEADFEPEKGGGREDLTAETEVGVRVTGRLTDAAGNQYVDGGSTTYTVSVTNEGAGNRTGGRAGTGGNAAGKDPGRGSGGGNGNGRN